MAYQGSLGVFLLPEYVIGNHGNTFPTNPWPRMCYFRDDLNAWYIWNGTYWQLPEHIPRQVSQVSGDITPDLADGNVYINTAQAAALTINNPVNVTYNFTKLQIRLEDDGVARAITWGAQYRGLEFALPATTVAGMLLYMGFIYNLTDVRWDMVAINQQ
jgi:hypothetical protein